MKGRTINSRAMALSIVLLAGLLCSAEALAAIDNNGVMDTVLDRFKINASAWATSITAVATRLFWTLVLISMVWTFGMMALRKADLGEFFAEFVRFTIFTGFFWWLLINGPTFAMSIIDSLMQVGGTAAAVGGYATTFSPSNIVDIGFVLFGKTLEESSVWSPVDSMAGMVLGLGILLLTALIAINMLMLLISAWILAYGGIFFLGFGGSRWTHDMAINYYRAVLGIAIQIMTMILLVGIGVSLINGYYANMQSEVEFTEMAVVLIVTLTIFILSNKVPQLLSGIITGYAPGGMGIGQFSAGAVLGATATTAAATSMAGSMVASGAAQGAGGVSALMAAYSQANQNVAAGSDRLANTLSGSGDHDVGGSPGGALPGSSNTPFAQAAGFSQQSPSGGHSGPENRPTTQGGVLAAAAIATRVGAGTAANLAKGTVDVASAKVGSVVDGVKARIADTTGGRIASAIHARGAESSDVDSESEVAAFVNRDNNDSV